MYSERLLNPPVVYTTDRSKAVVPIDVVLILCSFVVYTTRHFMFGLALLFVYVFVFSCPFSILITLLGEEGASLCVYRAFVC